MTINHIKSTDKFTVNAINPIPRVAEKHHDKYRDTMYTKNEEQNDNSKINNNNNNQNNTTQNNNINKRAIIIVLDSFGLGALPDAHKFGDIASDTLGNIDKYCHENNLKFAIPNLLNLGLADIYSCIHNKQLYCAQKHAIHNSNYNNLSYNNTDDTIYISHYYGACMEMSSGKDTTSGHWEITGVPVLFDWGYFTQKTNTFPEELLNRIKNKAKLKNILGNCHASGTEIINQLGEEHMRSNDPIFYTSADSVVQIACSEETFGLKNLYNLCEIVRGELADYNIARVIARPFIRETGKNAENGKFVRTHNRRDYSLLPHQKTLLKICQENNGVTVGIGKISDIFANDGIDISLKAHGINDLCTTTINAMQQYTDNKTIIMTNLVDFDMLYGHRRDVFGYKTALEQFDTIIPHIIQALNVGDMLVFTADHGCDPTFIGSDHTREYIPCLFSVKNKHISERSNKLIGVLQKSSPTGLIKFNSK